MPQRENASQRRTSLRLLGGWQLVDNGAELRLSHREQRLIALLGLSGERARPHVAGLLWPDSTDERALASLRRAVMQTQHARPGLLHVGRAFVGLDPAIEVDVAEVRRAAGVSELPEADDEQSHLLALLSGEELLPGWYDDWVLAERESLAAAAPAGPRPGLAAGAGPGRPGARHRGRPVGHRHRAALGVGLRGRSPRAPGTRGPRRRGVRVPTLSRSHVGQRRGRPVGPDPGARRVRRRDDGRRRCLPRAAGAATSAAPAASTRGPAASACAAASG